MAPSRAYLLLEDQPAMKTMMALTEPTAARNSTPTFRSAITIRWPKGSTANTSMPGIEDEDGRQPEHPAVDVRLVMASLVRSLTVSAMVWRMPQGPTRLGPRRDWMRAISRRSAQTKIIWLRTRNSTMARQPMRAETT